MIKVFMLLVLVGSALFGNMEAASASTSLGEGIYTVGKEISAGLNKFSIAEGEAEFTISRGGKEIVWDFLDSKQVYGPKQFTARLKAGDRVELYFEPGTKPVTVELVAKADLAKLPAGFYEAGVDFAVGTYQFKLNGSTDEFGIIEVYNSANNYKDELYVEGSATETYKLLAGDKIYVYNINGTISMKTSTVLPASLKLSKSTLAIANNQSYKVTAAVSPANAADKGVAWKSSNTKVATVDANGIIKGIASGKASITATAKGNAKVYQTVAVTVSAKTVKLSKTSLSMAAGQAATLTASVTPADSTPKTVTWKSSNTKVATVDAKGKVTGKAKGTATITASVSGGKAATAKVTVTAPITAQSVKLDKTSFTLTPGKTAALKATVSPSNATNKSVTWKSSNTKVATVDSKGTVKAIGAGSVKITATTANGKIGTATVNVPYVKSLSAGTWKGGTHIPAGRYKITTKSGSGNLVIGMGTDRFVNEILSGSDESYWGVQVVTTDIKTGDKIEIKGLNSVQFTKVANVKSNTLHAGHWTVGKDINAGRYRVTTPSGSGNFVTWRGSSLVINEILSAKKEPYYVTNITQTFKTGDRIEISGMNKVVFTPSK